MDMMKMIESPMITAEKAMQLVPNTTIFPLDIPLQAIQLAIGITTLTVLGIGAYLLPLVHTR